MDRKGILIWCLTIAVRQTQCSERNDIFVFHIKCKVGQNRYKSSGSPWNLCLRAVGLPQNTLSVYEIQVWVWIGFHHNVTTERRQPSLWRPQEVSSEVLGGLRMRYLVDLDACHWLLFIHLLQNLEPVSCLNVSTKIVNIFTIINIGLAALSSP